MARLELYCMYTLEVVLYSVHTWCTAPPELNEMYNADFIVSATENPKKREGWKTTWELLIDILERMKCY